MIMESSDYIESIKLQLTGGVLESELDDQTLEKILDMSLKEINKYYNATELIQLPGASCIDLKGHPEIANVVNVYRTSPSTTGNNYDSDPVSMSQLQYSIGGSYFRNNTVYGILAYNTAQRLSNTMSTDLIFKEDKKARKLYVNLPQGVPSSLTIEYIPRLMDASDIVATHWEDMLMRLFLAHCKIALGRIRTRFTQSGAVWTGDGETILSEGTAELEAVREALRKANDYMSPVD